jgi:peptidoglycan/LPS O-acetylase OafA/YrhL
MSAWRAYLLQAAHAPTENILCSRRSACCRNVTIATIPAAADSSQQTVAAFGVIISRLGESEPSAMSTASSYRRDIEGLRALAVVPVILYHARLFCPGGFVGVDVFFVISGYLITKIIESSGKRFTFMSFYDRRIRRIFPALFVMLAIVSAFAAILLGSGELIFYGKSLVASGAFASNIFFGHRIGYFDAASAEQPLLHIWSLAVEEQFYIVWPAVLVAINSRFTERTKTAVLAAMLVASLAYSQFLVQHSREAAFYLTPSRAWELLLGALLATPIASRWNERMPRNAADLASLIGVLLIGFAIIAYDEKTPFPGVAGLIPCFGAALVIWTGEFGPTAGGRFLSLSAIAFTGRISYSLYLWHWPILVFARLYLGRELHLDEAFWLIGLVAIAAYLSWRFVEEPFRHVRTANGARSWVAGGVFAGFVAAGAGALIILYDGFPSRTQAGREIALAIAEARAFQKSPCLARGAALPPVEGCLLGKASRDNDYDVVLWGDSHAAQLAPALVTLGKQWGFTTREITKAGCAPLPGVRFIPAQEFRLDCPEFNQAAMDAIVKRPSLTVILAAVWDAFAAGQILLAQGPRQPSVAQSRQNFVATMKGTVRALTSAGHRVIVVGEAPVPRLNPVNCIERAQLIGRTTSECTLASAERAEADRRVKGLLRLALQSEHAKIISLFEQLCDARECRIRTDQGKFVYMDETHLSAAGAELVGVSLADGLKRP